MQAYGDVYFRAWRAATGPYLEAIEQVGPWLVGRVVGWLSGRLGGWVVGWLGMHACVCMHARKYNITCADAPRHPTPHSCTYPMKNSRQDCVQDLMQCAVTCASPALYASLRLFLQARPSALSLLFKYKQRKNEGETRRRTGSSTLTHPKLNQPLPTTHTHKAQAFHANKRLREVDAMLLRLYNPILWRCVFAFLRLNSCVSLCICMCMRGAFLSSLSTHVFFYTLTPIDIHNN